MPSEARSGHESPPASSPHAHYLAAHDEDDDGPVNVSCHPTPVEAMTHERTPTTHSNKTPTKPSWLGVVSLEDRKEGPSPSSDHISDPLSKRMV